MNTWLWWEGYHTSYTEPAKCKRWNRSYPAVKFAILVYLVTLYTLIYVCFLSITSLFMTTKQHHHVTEIDDGRTNRHSFAIGALILIACMGWRWLGAYGPAYMPQRAYLGGIVLFALVSYIPFIKASGWKALVIIVTLWLFAFALEYLAVTHCFLYGCFEYGDALGTKLMGAVPRTIFFSRTPLVLGVARIVHQVRTPMFVQALLGWFLLIVVDLLIDPVAVASGFRSFQQMGPWYGIPGQNFSGWFVSGTIGVYLFLSLIHDAHADKSLRNDYLRRSLMLTVLCFTSAALTLELRWPAAIWSGIFVYFMYHLYKNPPVA